MALKLLYALWDAIQKKNRYALLKTQKSYEGIKFEFSNDCQAAILTGSDLFLT